MYGKEARLAVLRRFMEPQHHSGRTFRAEVVHSGPQEPQPCLLSNNLCTYSFCLAEQSEADPGNQQGVG